VRKRKYIFLMTSLFLILAACKTNENVVDTIPTGINKEQYKSYIQQLLSVSPTPCPTSYPVFSSDKEIEIGDIVTMGKYVHEDAGMVFGENLHTDGIYSDNIKISKGKPIAVRWLVLDRKENNVLLLSLYGIDAKPFNEKNTKGQISWETSTLRDWLNGDFLEGAFDENEQTCISTAVGSEEDELSDADNVMKDKIFLLSVREAKKYFETDIHRKTHLYPARETEIYEIKLYNPYAYDMTYFDDFKWWLRSGGQLENSIAYVDVLGEVMEEGLSAESAIAIRPAMWVDLSKVKEIGLAMAVEE